jgi:peptidoglycan/LPS O-acetylase OafA/YrhL
MSTTALRPAASAGRPGTRRHARTTRTHAEHARIVEIDGLRAVALLLVVLFHLFGQGRVSGGVDVFLFVSGVVLALSLRSGVRKGRERRVLERWARTFGRLAPPAAVVLAAIVVMAFTILPPWTRTQTVTEVVSAALYAENWQLIVSQLAYGAAGPLTSPVQHFWSLSIQGQLFIIVPALVALVYLARRFVVRPGTVLWTLAVVATAASFAYALVANAEDSAAAYFDTFARAWEFGAGLLVGGLLGLGAATKMPFPTMIGWVGLAMILSSGFVLDGATAYPAAGALLPVGGAALVVLSIGASGPMSAGRLLSSRIFSPVIKISYALYLWHWPVLIGYLAIRERVDGAIGWRGAGLVLVVSLALALATWWGLERPLARLLSNPGRYRGAVPALVAMLAVPALALGALWLSHAARPAVEAGGCHGAASADPQRPECADAIDPAAPLLPALDALRTDDDNRPECWARPSSEDFAMCTVGREEGYTKRLVAVGDSHSNTLLGVYEQIALAHGWRIDIAGRAACHWTDTPRDQHNRALARRCENWNAAVDRYVATTPLDGILVTNSSKAEYTVAPGEDVADARARGYASAWAERANPATPVIAIRDNPVFGSAALECVLSADDVAAGECTRPRDTVILDDGLSDAVALDPYAHLIDLNHFMCDEETCSMVVGGVITTRDGAHLTATYARSLAPYLDREISGVLGG